ncbi:MAG: hypothetical protein OXP69_01225 [Spirochaetaceae bacterium]|nr:hypothetical protein [Spirochaetaceae bacterium]
MATTDDDELEADESFTLVLTEPAGPGPNWPPGVTLHATAATAQATILDNDAVTATVAAAAPTVTEGGDATFTVTLSGATPKDSVTIGYQTSGTATSGTDYTAPYEGSSGTLTFAAAVTGIGVTVTTLTDEVFEGRETLVLELTGADTAIGTARVGTPDAATVTIIDDGTLTATITADQAAVPEGAAAGFTVHLSGNPTGVAVTLGWHTHASTATAGADYRLTPQDNGTSGTVTIAAGETARSFTIATLTDRIFDPGETLTVTLDPARAPTGVAIGSPGSASTRITETARVTVDIAGPEPVTEGDPAVFTVTLSLPSAVPITVVCSTRDGTATGGSDYVPMVETLTFTPEVTVLSGPVTTLTDYLLEGEEEFDAVLSAPGGLPAGVSIGTSTATAILLDAIIPVEVSFELERYTAHEGGVAAVVGMLLDQQPGRPLRIPLTTTNQGGAGDDDYTGVPAAVTFGEYDTRRTFTVTAIDDAVVDPGESVLIGFGPLPPAVSAGTPPQTTVGLVDDEEKRQDVLEETLGTFARGILWSAARVLTDNPPCAVPATATIGGHEIRLTPDDFSSGEPPPAAGVLESPTADVDVDELLGRSAFTAPLHAGISDPCWTLWARGDVQRFHVGGGADGSHQAGDLKSAWLGADVAIDEAPVLVGLAVSRNVGRAHYGYAYDDGIGSVREGTLDIGMTAAHAYLRRPATAEHVGYWGMVSLGGGMATDTPAGKSAEESDLVLVMGAVGLRGVLGATAEPLAAAAPGVNEPAGAAGAAGERRGELALFGDLGVAVLATARGERAIDSLHAPVARVRAGTQVAETRPVGGDAAITGSLELWGGYDGGPGAAGLGLGTALGLSFTSPLFTAEVRGHTLLATDYRAHGASLTARYGPRQDGGGLSLSLVPSWGASAGVPRELWQESSVAAAAHGGGFGLDAGIGYGIAVPGTEGVVTPFGEASFTGDGGTRQMIGVRFSVLPHVSGYSLDLALAGERSVAPAAAQTHRVTLRLHLRY